MVGALGLALKDHGRARTLKGLPVAALDESECVLNPRRPFKVRALP